MAIQKDVPGGKVPVDEVLTGEVSHPICNLLGELQQEGSKVGVLGRPGEGQTAVVGACVYGPSCTAGGPLTPLRGGSCGGHLSPTAPLLSSPGVGTGSDAM